MSLQFPVPQRMIIWIKSLADKQVISAITAIFDEKAGAHVIATGSQGVRKLQQKEITTSRDPRRGESRSGSGTATEDAIVRARAADSAHAFGSVYTSLQTGSSTPPKTASMFPCQQAL